MAYDEGHTYPFGYQAVHQQVPVASGVYTLYTARQWVYAGESDDVRQSLLRHLNAPSTCMARWGPLSFSFEEASPSERGSRHRALVKELRPTCNPQAA